MGLQGAIAMPFNTPGMFRGAKTSLGDDFVRVWDR